MRVCASCRNKASQNLIPDRIIMYLRSGGMEKHTAQAYVLLMP